MTANHEHSWRVRSGDFKTLGNREGGGIANLVRRVCERCPAYHEQVEISWPAPWLHGNADDRRYTVEDGQDFDGPPPPPGRFHNGTNHGAYRSAALGE